MVPRVPDPPKQLTATVTTVTDAQVAAMIAELEAYLAGHWGFLLWLEAHGSR